MKKLLIVIAVFILAACSQHTNSDQVATVPEITATTMIEVKVYPTQDKIISAINTSFSIGGHANELTCGQCHLDDKEAKAGKLTWTDQATGHIETISRPTELCVKCHQDQAVYTLQDGANLLAHSEFECTACHDPHILQAGCAGSLCHVEIQTTLNAQITQPENHSAGGDINSLVCGGSTCHDLVKKVADTSVFHQPAHQKVPCYVCHDKSGLAILLAENQHWITIEDLQQATSSNGKQVISHAIGTSVECSKCHSFDNTWNLTVIPENDKE